MINENYAVVNIKMGNLEGGVSTGDFQRWLEGALEKGHLSLKGLIAEGSFTGDPGLNGRLWR